MLARALGVILVMAATAGGASADRPDAMVLVEPDTFAEKYSGNTQVSGQLLAGLSYLPSSGGQLDPQAIGLAASLRSGEQVCVRLVTEDGRYWSGNLFEQSTELARPAWLSLPTAYPTQLGSYSMSGLLVLAARTEDCTDVAGKLLIPAVIGDAPGNAPLLAFVNVSQGRTTAWLERDGDVALDRVPCNEPSDGARVTYSAICSFETSGRISPGEYDLIVAIRSLTGGTFQESYRIVID